MPRQATSYECQTHTDCLLVLEADDEEGRGNVEIEVVREGLSEMALVCLTTDAARALAAELLLRADEIDASRREIPL